MSHLVGQLLNSIHDARTHVYKKNKIEYVRRNTKIVDILRHLLGESLNYEVQRLEEKIKWRKM